MNPSPWTLEAGRRAGLEEVLQALFSLDGPRPGPALLVDAAHGVELVVDPDAIRAMFATVRMQFVARLATWLP